MNDDLPQRVEEYYQAAYENLMTTVDAVKKQGFKENSGWASFFARNNH